MPQAAGFDNLRHGGHSHRVGSHGAVGSYLGGGFVAGAGNGDINPLPQGDFQLLASVFIIS